MRFHKTVCLFVFSLLALNTSLHSQDLTAFAKIYQRKLETNLIQNIVAFWYPDTLDRENGGYILNHDIEGQLKARPATKMIVTQARMVWFYSRLALAGYDREKYLDAAKVGYRFLKNKMWDKTNGGFYWEADVTGNKVLRPMKHLYGQSFALFALSEYYLASGDKEALELATELFDLLEAKAHDNIHGGYHEWFNADWTPAPADEMTYMGDPAYKLMNTHLHLLESMTAFYRASKLPLARERLLELIQIEGSAVVRKDLGGCTDKYQDDWTPVLTGNFARVSYGHDLENIWLLVDACKAAGISTFPFLDLYRSQFDYALKYGFDEKQGGFFYSGPFNRRADNREKNWWVQAEALVSSLYMYRLTGDEKYLDVFEKTYDWVDKYQVDWKHGEWFDTIMPDGTPRGDKAQIWKSGYHNGRAMLQCLQILKSQE